jgi:hypothetical protein
LKISFLVTYDVPDTGEFDTCPAAQREMAGRLEDILARRSPKAEVRVQPHTLTPAEIASLP